METFYLVIQFGVIGVLIAIIYAGKRAPANGD